MILTTSYREVIECKHGKTRIKPEILVNKLNGRNCKSLAGKPKILVIQELRNKQLTSDSGNEQQTKRHHIPTHADMLIYTFRGDSPIFPQTLCATLLENSSQVNSVDLVSQLTMVTNAVHQQTGIVPEMFSTLIKLIRMSK